jgi:hypothetical protein
VIAPDDNKVFGISFRTPPADRLVNQNDLYLFIIN